MCNMSPQGLRNLFVMIVIVPSAYAGCCLSDVNICGSHMPSTCLISNLEPNSLYLCQLGESPLRIIPCPNGCRANVNGINDVCLPKSSNLIPLHLEPDIIPSEGTLDKGQILWSRNKTAKLLLQEDGNLVVYQVKSNQQQVAMWTSGTSSLVVKPVTLMVLSNGDIILLNDAGETVWKLGTAGKKYAGASLWLKNDGSLCLTMDQTSCLWSTSFSFQQPVLKTNTDGTVTTATSLAMQKALKMPVVRGDAEILAHCLFFTNCSYSCRTDCDKNSGKLKQIVPAKNRNLRYTYYSCALQVPLDVKVHWKDSDGIVTKFFDSSRQDEVIATCAFYRGLWYECFGVSECTGLTSITQTCSAGSAPWTGFYQGSPAEGWRGNITQTAMNGSGSSRNQLSSNGDTGVIQTCN